MSRRLALAFFTAAILFSMIREWSAPASCPRAALPASHTLEFK
jgi:hypothetical protein